MRVKIDDITTSCLGKMLDAKKNKGEFHPYLANINVRWGAFDLDSLSLMKFEEHEHERYGLQYGDLVMCEGGEPGRCAIWKNQVPDMKIQKALHRLRAKEGLDIFYLYYWFLFASMNNLLSGYFTETTIKHLSGVQLKELELDLPIFEIQKGVTGVLKSIDDKIELNNKINQELEEMAKTLYDYWFVQFDFPDEQGNPYRSSGGKMVFCKELNREIPEGWGVKKIGDILGNIPNTKRIQTSDYQQCGDLPIIDQSTKFIAGFTSDNSTKLSFEKGCIIFGDHTRIVKFINFDFARGADGTQVLVSKERNISEIQLYFIVKSIDLSNYGYARHFKFLKDKPVIIPNTEVHTIFNEKAEAMFAQIGKNTFENEELTTLRDWLLPMLMNGQAVVG